MAKPIGTGADRKLKWTTRSPELNESINMLKQTKREIIQLDSVESPIRYGN